METEHDLAPQCPKCRDRQSVEWDAENERHHCVDCRIVWGLSEEGGLVPDCPNCNSDQRVEWVEQITQWMCRGCMIEWVPAW